MAAPGPAVPPIVSADAATVGNNQIQSNQTAGDGGGLSVEGTPITTFFNNTVSDNTVRLDYTTETTVLQDDVVIQATGQVVAHKGQTITGRSASAGNGGGLNMVDSSGVFTDNIFLHNINQSGEGGGLYVSGSSIAMTNTLVVRNHIALSSTYGSGYYVINSAVRLVYTTIADNPNDSTDPGATGAGIYVTKGATETSSLNLVNNIISGQKIGVLLTAGNTAAMQSTMWNNTDINWDGAGVFDPVAGNFRGDPRFVNPSGGDYHIQRDSAAFDVGVNAGVPFDLEGTPRPSGFGFDAGAYEHHYVKGVYLQASASPAFVNNGDTIQYTVRLINNSTATMNNVQVHIGLPGQQSADDISGGDSCSGSSCTINSMAVGQSASIIMHATATGTPPDQGFIEMATNVSVSSPSFVDSDRQQSLKTRLQKCRVQYNGADYGTIQAAVNAVNDFDETPDLIKVNGYCGGSVTISKKMTVQGGWNPSFSVLDPSNTPAPSMPAAQAGRCKSPVTSPPPWKTSKFSTAMRQAKAAAHPAKTPAAASTLKTQRQPSSIFTSAAAVAPTMAAASMWTN